jgi:hypothetical protein
LLHLIPKGQVRSTGNFGAALGPLLPQAKQTSKEVEMGLDSLIRLTKVDKRLKQGGSTWDTDCKSQSHSTDTTLGGKDESEPQIPS